MTPELAVFDTLRMWSRFRLSVLLFCELPPLIGFSQNICLGFLCSLVFCAGNSYALVCQSSCVRRRIVTTLVSDHSVCTYFSFAFSFVQFCRVVCCPQEATGMRASWDFLFISNRAYCSSVSCRILPQGAAFHAAIGCCSDWLVPGHCRCGRVTLVLTAVVGI